MFAMATYTATPVCLSNGILPVSCAAAQQRSAQSSASSTNHRRHRCHGYDEGDTGHRLCARFERITFGVLGTLKNNCFLHGNGTLGRQGAGMTRQNFSRSDSSPVPKRSGSPQEKRGHDNSDLNRLLKDVEQSAPTRGSGHDSPPPGSSKSQTPDSDKSK